MYKATRSQTQKLARPSQHCRSVTGNDCVRSPPPLHPRPFDNESAPPLSLAAINERNKSFGKTIRIDRRRCEIEVIPNRLKTVSVTSYFKIFENLEMQYHKRFSRFNVPSKRSKSSVFNYAAYKKKQKKKTKSNTRKVQILRDPKSFVVLSSIFLFVSRITAHSSVLYECIKQHRSAYARRLG